MRNLNPEQHDTGTRLATPPRRRPFPSTKKEIGDVCTQAMFILMALTLLKLNRVSLKTGFQIALVPGEESVQYKTD